MLNIIVGVVLLMGIVAEAQGLPYIIYIAENGTSTGDGSAAKPYDIDTGISVANITFSDPSTTNLTLYFYPGKLYPPVVFL